jgi:hypothetical protein
MNRKSQSIAERQLEWLRARRADIAAMTREQIDAIAYPLFGCVTGPDAWSQAALLAFYDDAIAQVEKKIAYELTLAL